MSEVINFPTLRTVTVISAAGERLGHYDVARIGDTRDNVGTLLEMVAGIQHHPKRVACAAALSGMTRMVHLHGRTSTMGFANPFIETAEIVADLSQP